MKIGTGTWLVAAAALCGSAIAAQAATTDVPVHFNGACSNPTPPHIQANSGWLINNFDSALVANVGPVPTTNGSFTATVAGPLVPPIGSGSLLEQIGATGGNDAARVFFVNPGFSFQSLGTVLSVLTEFSYGTEVQMPALGGGPSVQIFLNLGLGGALAGGSTSNGTCTSAGTPNACCTGSMTGTCDQDDIDDILVFNPGLNVDTTSAPLGVGVWQTWDMKAGNWVSALGNHACGAANTPFTCCTGALTGTCDAPGTATAYAASHATAKIAFCDPTVNAQCTGAGTPDACCTGAGTGTCTGVCNPPVAVESGNGTPLGNPLAWNGFMGNVDAFHLKVPIQSVDVSFDFEPDCTGYGGDSDGDCFCDGFNDPCPYDPTNTDTDHDGICDVRDLCPTVADPTNQDLDLNGIGDACQTTPVTTMDLLKLRLKPQKPSAPTDNSIASGQSQFKLLSDPSAGCTGSGAPAPCCTGSGTGTCGQDVIDASKGFNVRIKDSDGTPTMTKTFPGSGCKTSTGGKSISCKTSDKKSKLQLSQIFGTTNLYKARFKLKGVGLMDTTLQQPFTVTLTTGFTSRAGSLGSPHCVFGANGSVSCRP